MTCKLTRPDPQALFNQIRDQFSVTVLGGAPVIPESNEWYVVTNDYAMAEQYYAIADQMWRETNPETACCDNLIAMAARNGVFPRPATFAEGYVKLSGTPGAAIPDPLEIATSAGNYVSVGRVPAFLFADGTAVVRVRALAPGPQYNASGDVPTGTLLTPAVGINSEVEVCGGQFCGGADAEACEAFRQRYLRRLAYKPRATSAWIQEKLLEWPCATRVCTREGSCCRCEPDCGNCGCAGCGDKLQFYVMFDAFPCGIAPTNVIQDLNDWMFGTHQGYGEGQVEVGVCGAIFQPIPLYVNVLIDIAACPTIAQKSRIEQDIQDLFTQLCPSMPLRNKQIEVIIANIIGSDVNVGVQIEMIDATRDMAYQTGCGDVEPECDYLPCLNQIEFIAPRSGAGNC